MGHMNNHQIRTRVDEATFDAVTGAAALAGVSIAEYVRGLIEAGVSEASDTPVRPQRMSPDEAAQFKRWQAAAYSGADKRAWRVDVDKILRQQGHDLPPLLSTPDGLIAWACAAHPFTAAAKAGVTPPRWEA